MSPAARFFLPVVIASVAAPMILGAVFQHRLQALFEYEANDLVGLPFVLLLIIGGLLVFVLPVGRLPSLRASKAMFFLASCLAGFLGGTFMVIFAGFVASMGGNAFDLADWLMLSLYIGAILGTVSAAIWAVFNLPRPAND